jgi:aminoglycoside phosphotransferase (APT) family kinase protein
MDKSAITTALASRLVAGQFPQWADLPVTRVEPDGNDNMTFRLGEEMSVRLPSADRYAPQVDKEHRLLPILAAQLPLSIPEPWRRAHPRTDTPLALVHIPVAWGRTRDHRANCGSRSIRD